MEVTDAARGSGDAQVLTGIPVVGANDPVKDPMQLEIKEQEIKRMGIELLAKDQMLQTLQKALQDNTSQAEELVSEAKAIARRTEDTFQSQLLEKDKQLKIMQGLLDDASSRSGSTTASVQEKLSSDTPDRAFMDDFLLTVLEQKDRLADELHSLNNEYARLKARLGMAEFQKEKLQAESRAHQRKVGTERNDGCESQGTADLGQSRSHAESETYDVAHEDVAAVVSERDMLAEKLTEANRTVKNLSLQLEQSRASREAARQRRKQAFRDEKSSGQQKGVVSSEQLKALLGAKGKAPAKRSGEAGRQLADKHADEMAQLDAKVELLKRSGPESDRDSIARPALSAEMAALTENGQLQTELADTRKTLTEREAVIQSQRSALDSNAVELEMLRDLLASGPGDRLQAELSRAELQLDGAQAELARALEGRTALEQELAEAIAEVEGKGKMLVAAEKVAAQQRDLLDAADALSADIGKQHADVCRALDEEKCARRQAEERVVAITYDLDSLRAADAKLHEDLAAARGNATRCSALFAREQRQRVALQNKLVELCGNIRVHCRVRPLKSTSGNSADQREVRVVSKAVVEARVQGLWRQFEYDRAYLPSEESDAIFAEVSPLVSSFVDGYNVCIMAYGQTGSGKTHTMLGPSDEHGVTEMNGVIPRTMNELFRLMETEAESASFAIRVSVMEVYNDYVRDLLSPKPWEKHEVTEGSGMVDAPTVQQVEVGTATGVLELVERGMSSRVERRTDMNAHSSRSHLIVCVHCTRTPRPEVGGVVTASRIHLVDLAGSENAKMAGSEGAGLLEGKAINRSLSALSGVLDALGKQGSKGKQHVPYRNSKLTHLLKDSIGGDAKMLMIACTSPETKSMAESVQTLRFGESARRVQKGAAQKKIVKSGSSKAKQVAANALKLM